MINICKVRIELNGIYSWGTGFNNALIADAYESFLSRKLNRNTGHFILGKRSTNYATPYYLFGTNGSLYIHPMEITGFMVDEYGSGFKNELKELEEFVKELEIYIANLTGYIVTHNSEFSFNENEINFKKISFDM